MKWIPIEEKYPPHSTYLLVVVEKEIGKRKAQKIFIAFYVKKEEWIIMSYNEVESATLHGLTPLQGTITHWMRLPKNP